MKVENANGVIYKACAVKAKMYAIQFIQRLADTSSGLFYFNSDHLEAKRFKGLPKFVVSKDCNFEQFVESLFIPFQYYAVYKQIRNINHKLYTIEIRKKSVSGLDLKRFSISPVDNLAYGNADIKKIEAI